MHVADNTPLLVVLKKDKLKVFLFLLLCGINVLHVLILLMKIFGEGRSKHKSRPLKLHICCYLNWI